MLTHIDPKNGTQIYVPGQRRQVAVPNPPVYADQVPSNSFYLMAGQRKIPLVHHETIVGRNGNLMVHVNHVSVAIKHAVILLKNFEGVTQPTIE